MSTDIQAELARLRAENTHLKMLLQKNDISWEVSPALVSVRQCEMLTSACDNPPQFSAAEKIVLFRRLFRGRNDVYPQRWETQKGTAGYSPVCDNEWRAGICGKPKVKCGNCGQRQLRALTDQAIYEHLTGKKTLGVYPLLANDTCYFLAIDFDEDQWQEDALGVMLACQQCNIPASLEISRSGKGAHIWIFFSAPVTAREARLLGAALISYTCEKARQLSLSSYDRFFPSQDTLPRGGFGNLIALPLQKLPREHGRSVFVDLNLQPYPDQWGYLNSVIRMTPEDIVPAILQVSGGKNVLDVPFADDEEMHTPWEKTNTPHDIITGPLPSSLSIVLANEIFIEKKDIPQPLLNRLIRLAAFPNPEFYKAQAMRLPVWNKARIICCADNFAQHIALPRGCLDSLLMLLSKNGVHAVIDDKRVKGRKLSVVFTGKLHKEQQQAVKAMLKHDIGILHAPTAFGKTVSAAALIAKRKVSTLVLVHRAELLRQWQERLAGFLTISPKEIGTIGGGKSKPSGNIDIALMQSLSRKDNASELLEKYGHIIVDECHHVSAFSFEGILKQVKARFILGLTATPQRRDGHHPIIFMQCGNIRHSAGKTDRLTASLEVRLQKLEAPILPQTASIQDVFRELCDDTSRNEHIVADIVNAWNEGRNILALTERIGHLMLLNERLVAKGVHCHVLHGKLSAKDRARTLAEIKVLPATAARVILATGRLIGEGFDHSPLDTMVLAMPIAWQGTLQQYAGRLHREHSGKTDIRVYDYAENDNAQLQRMWKKRRVGYEAMGYSIVVQESPSPFVTQNGSCLTVP